MSLEDEKPIEESNRLLTLTEEIKSSETPISPTKKAEYATLAVAYELERGEIDPIKAHEFAKSMVEDCIVPVEIGTEKVKICSTEVIINSRPAIVESMKKVAKEAGADYDEINGTQRDKALMVVGRIEKDVREQNNEYGPFSGLLTPEQRLREGINKAERETVAKQLLGKESEPQPIDEKEFKHFAEVSLPNVLYGTTLKDKIEGNYTL